MDSIKESPIVKESGVSLNATSPVDSEGFSAGALFATVSELTSAIHGALNENASLPSVSISKKGIEKQQESRAEESTFSFHPNTPKGQLTEAALRLYADLSIVLKNGDNSGTIAICNLCEAIVNFNTIYQEMPQKGMPLIFQGIENAITTTLPDGYTILQGAESFLANPAQEYKNPDGALAKLQEGMQSWFHVNGEAWWNSTGKPEWENIKSQVKDNYDPTISQQLFNELFNLDSYLSEIISDEKKGINFWSSPSNVQGFDNCIESLVSTLNTAEAAGDLGPGLSYLDRILTEPNVYGTSLYQYCLEGSPEVETVVMNNLDMLFTAVNDSVRFFEGHGYSYKGI